MQTTSPLENLTDDELDEQVQACEIAAADSRSIDPLALLSAIRLLVDLFRELRRRKG